ncbi:hypothetical protein ACHEXK_05350 [Limnohabitans sp. DCL3]|uniref:hypothetical protein n=1 Tax=Limnohabitans sp. DCL3 TaxID=3374103 RepID=UPI003A86D62C
MAGATVVVKDSSGAEVQTCAPCTVGSDGLFSVELQATAKAPFVLLVSQDGSDEPQVSMIDTAKSATVNVSPITTLIAARLSPSGDPAQLTAADSSAAKIATATTDIKTALQPVLEAAGVAADANPLTMVFKADSTGLDKALDILGKPTIVRNSEGKAHVEVEIKTSGSDEATDADNSPAKIGLTAGAAAPVATGITLAKMQATLPADGVSLKIQKLMQRMQDCYATAPADRRPSGATLASQITAEACKAMFVDNDPSKYLHNNTVVSQSKANVGGRFSGAFKGIFNTLQGIRFDQPEYRYTIKNGNTDPSDLSKPVTGDVVFTARWTVTDPNAGDSLGQSDVSEYHARVQNGELKLIGNQSKHDLNINAQARREEMPAVANYAYMATGYNIGISERRWDHDKNSSTAKVSMYEQVVVTSPSGRTFTFKPITGNNYDYLGLVNQEGNTTTSATVMLNGAYLNAATTGHPSERFTKVYWGSKMDWTEEAIKAIPAQGNWQFDITLTDDFVKAPENTGTAKNFPQYRRSINRAPTLAELQSVKWPALKDPVKAALSAQAANPGFVNISSGDVAALAVIDGWDVPTGAWAPTYAKVYGNKNNVGWDEGVDVASTARKVSIRCTSAAAHCATAPADAGKFLNAGYGYLQFSGRDSKRLQMSLNYSTRKTSSD